MNILVNTQLLLVNLSVDKKVQNISEPHLKLKNGSVSQIKKNGLASHQVSVPTTGQGVNIKHINTQDFYHIIYTSYYKI